MIDSEMPFQHRKPLAALETDQVIGLYGLPDGTAGSPCGGATGSPAFTNA